MVATHMLDWRLRFRLPIATPLIVVKSVEFQGSDCCHLPYEDRHLYCDKEDQMRPTRLIGILGFVTATTFGGYTLRAAVQAQSNRTDEEAIRRTIVALTDGMNKHDAKAIARLYTRDGDLINVFGGWWKGPAEIENGLKTHFDAELKSAKFTTSDVEIRFIKPDVAIGHVTNQVSGIVGPNGQTVPAHGERSIRVFVKENGSWLMTAFHNTQVAPSEPLVRPRRQDHEAAATFTTGCYYSRRMSRALRQAVVY